MEAVLDAFIKSDQANERKAEAQAKAREKAQEVVDGS